MVSRIDFKKIRFFSCIGLQKQLDALTLPHFITGHGCIIGRSNVGKSSLINHLFCNDTLAKTSSTPGKTETLNFFLVDEKLLLVDLPGYGFARKSRAKQGDWSELIDAYFAHFTLNFALLLIDINIPLQNSDKQMYLYMAAKNIPTVVIYTKCDKLAKTKRAHTHKMLEETIIKETALTPFSSLCYSVKEPGCRQELISIISNCVPK